MAWSSHRREFLGLGARAAAVGAASRFFATELHAAAPPQGELFAQLDRFAEQYLRDMNAPGLTVAVADRDGLQRVVTYGLGDRERATPVGPDQLFQIGSISKSFVAICLLQLRDEGRLDLHRPFVEYLPWLRIESAFAPITTHHLLTHTAGLPANPPLFLSDPAAKHRAAYAPGAKFHYCNTGYHALGYLVWALDGRPLPEALRARVLEPLGMTQSEPALTFEARERMVKSYYPFLTDRPYPRQGRLAEAPAIVSTEGAGCIASTPWDMGFFVQMIANRGRGPKGRLLSEESFALFAQKHIEAAEFGPGAGYGYGIMVDALDGHTLLRHTGGMVSFASAMQVDVDEGVGAFASINAMQGFRPNPVARYAIELLRARRAKKPLPPIPPPRPATQIERAADYAGTYRGQDGRTLELVAEGTRLSLVYKGQKLALEASTGAPETFLVPHPDFERFPLVFERGQGKDAPVVGVGWGGDWFVAPSGSAPVQIGAPPEWQAYVGHYRNENAWLGSLRIVLRRGRMMIDGVIPLEPGEGGLFLLRDEPHSPEWIRFAEVVNGQAMRLKFSGEDFWRVLTA